MYSVHPVGSHKSSHEFPSTVECSQDLARDDSGIKDNPSYSFIELLDPWHKLAIKVCGVFKHCGVKGSHHNQGLICDETPCDDVKYKGLWT